MTSFFEDIVGLLLEFRWLRRVLLLTVVVSLALFQAKINLFIGIVAALIIAVGLAYEFIEHRYAKKHRSVGGIQ